MTPFVGVGVGVGETTTGSIAWDVLIAGAARVGIVEEGRLGAVEGAAGLGAVDEGGAVTGTEVGGVTGAGRESRVFLKKVADT